MNEATKFLGLEQEHEEMFEECPVIDFLSRAAHAVDADYGKLGLAFGAPYVEMARLLTGTAPDDWVVLGDDGGAYAYCPEKDILFHPEFETGLEYEVWTDAEHPWSLLAQAARDEVIDGLGCIDEMSPTNSVCEHMLEGLFEESMGFEPRDFITLLSPTGISYQTGDKVKLQDEPLKIRTQGKTLQECYQALMFSWATLCYERNCGIPLEILEVNVEQGDTHLTVDITSRGDTKPYSLSTWSPATEGKDFRHHRDTEYVLYDCRCLKCNDIFTKTAAQIKHPTGLQGGCPRCETTTEEKAA